jgi:CheY-like chemotaxis protein
MKKFRQNRTIKRNVLIVDDEIVNREILGNILSTEYSVSYADNAEHALEILAGADSDFSLVLLDLLMPVMDGFAFLQRRPAD